MSFPQYRSRRRAAVVSQALGRGKGRSRRPSPGICAQQAVGTPTASQAAVVEAGCCDPEAEIRLRENLLMGRPPSRRAWVRPESTDVARHASPETSSRSSRIGSEIANDVSHASVESASRSRGRKAMS